VSPRDAQDVTRWFGSQGGTTGGQGDGLSQTCAPHTARARRPTSTPLQDLPRACGLLRMAVTQDLFTD